MRDEFDAPELPDDVVASDLAGEARMQLKTLAKDNADDVARHLAMVERLLDDDPAAAHQHALAASRRAGRIGVVRETLAITAYNLGDFGLALRELRTFRRITGSDEQLPLMVDCERGLGRPEKALELSRSVDASTLPTAVRVELAIARSGARLDLGQTQAALDELRIPELQRDVAHAYSPALFGAFATVLEDLGRGDEAAEWHELADRAIDALQQAADPGETETIHVLEEVVHVDIDEDAIDEDDLDVDVHTDAPDGEPADDEPTDEPATAPSTPEAEAPASIEEPAPIDTSADAIEAEVEELLAAAFVGTDSSAQAATDDTEASDAESDAALFSVDPAETGESAAEVAEAAQRKDVVPDIPAHEADDEAADGGDTGEDDRA